MSDPDAHWITTTPEARLTSGPEKVSVRDSLAPGTRLLDEFEILRVLGTGGFGIVYLARDHVLQRDIAIKEYMPAVLARRGEGATVSMRASTARLRPDLRQGPRIVPRRSPAARQLRPSGAGQGASLLARATAPPTWPCPTTPGRRLKDVRLQMLRGARRAWLRRLHRAAARRARAAARPGRLPPRHLARQHPDAARRPAGAARLRLRPPRRRQRLAVVHGPPQAAVRAARAVRRRGQPGAGAVDRPVLARRDAVLRRHRPRAARLGRARRARHRCRRSRRCRVVVPGFRPACSATIDWTLALAPDDRPQDVAAVRRALRGEIAPPPPSPRFAADAPAGPVAPAAPTAAGGARRAVEGRGGDGLRRRARGPAMRPGAALLLAFAGLATMGLRRLRLERRGAAGRGARRCRRWSMCPRRSRRRRRPLLRKCRPCCPPWCPPSRRPPCSPLPASPTRSAGPKDSKRPARCDPRRSPTPSANRRSSALRSDRRAKLGQGGRSRRARRVQRRCRHADHGALRAQPLPRSQGAQRTMRRSAAGRGGAAAPDGLGRLIRRSRARRRRSGPGDHGRTRRKFFVGRPGAGRHPGARRPDRGGRVVPSGPRLLAAWWSPRRGARHRSWKGRTAEQAMVARLIWDNYLETRANASRWSGLYWGMTFAAAAAQRAGGARAEAGELRRERARRKTWRPFSRWPPRC